MSRVRYDRIPLERVARRAGCALRAVWLEEAAAPREMDYQGRRFALDCRRFRILEDLLPQWGLASVHGIPGKHAVPVRPADAAPPELRPGTTIEAFNYSQIREVYHLAEKEKERQAWSAVIDVFEPDPTRPSDEGVLLLGNWYSNLAAFACFLDWSFVPVADLDRVRAWLRPRDANAPEWTRPYPCPM